MTKIKGFIFLDNEDRYYNSYTEGYACTRALAHVYSLEDIQQRVQACFGWGGRDSGHWIVVYE